MLRPDLMGWSILPKEGLQMSIERWSVDTTYREISSYHHPVAKMCIDSTNLKLSCRGKLFGRPVSIETECPLESVPLWILTIIFKDTVPYAVLYPDRQIDVIGTKRGKTTSMMRGLIMWNASIKTPVDYDGCLLE